jgi:ATP-dependent helicase/nuclease subunit B
VSGKPTRFEYWSLARNRERDFGFMEEPCWKAAANPASRARILTTRVYLEEAIARWILAASRSPRGSIPICRAIRTMTS